MIVVEGIPSWSALFVNGAVVNVIPQQIAVWRHFRAEMFLSLLIRFAATQAVYDVRYCINSPSAIHCSMAASSWVRVAS